MGKTTSSTMAIVLAALPIIATGSIAQARQSNPVDTLSNPAALDYGDVEIGPREMHEPFVRDGAVAGPKLFGAITPGLGQPQVEAALGAPLRRKGREWDYQFQLRMPQSANYLLCQYKVVFDDRLLVRETVWRRRQCQALADDHAS